MFSSFIRVWLAFFLYGIIYVILISLVGSILDKQLTNIMALFLIYIWLFIPNIICAIFMELLQKNIKKYIYFGLINMLFSIIIINIYSLTLHYYMNTDMKVLDIKSTDSLIVFTIFFITYFLVALILKYLYNQRPKKLKI